MITGETSQMAAECETYEEIGYHLSLDGIRPILTIHFDEEFDDIYLVQKDLNLDDLNLQEEEIKTVKGASKEKILSMIEESSFIPYHKSLIELLFLMRQTRRSYTR